MEMTTDTTPDLEALTLAITFYAQAWKYRQLDDASLNDLWQAVEREARRAVLRGQASMQCSRRFVLGGVYECPKAFGTGAGEVRWCESCKARAELVALEAGE